MHSIKSQKTRRDISPQSKQLKLVITGNGSMILPIGDNSFAYSMASTGWPVFLLHASKIYISPV